MINNKHGATYDPMIWVHTQKSLQRAFELMHTPRVTAVVLTTGKDRSCQVSTDGKRKREQTSGSHKRTEQS